MYNLTNDNYLYLMVNKQYGNAPSRNTFKRRAKSLFDHLRKQHVGLTFGLMIKPLKKNISYKELSNCFNNFNQTILLKKS